MSAGFYPVLTMIMAVLLQTDARTLPSNAPATQYLNRVGTDNYAFQFQTPDGISRTETGLFVDGVWTVIGEVSWTADDGKKYSYQYIANDKGYKQQDSISKPSEFTTTVRPVAISAVLEPDYRPGQIAASISCGTKASLLGCGK